MIAIVDVDYRESEAQAACVLAPDWSSGEPCGTQVARIAAPAQYQPGQFYRRELPCLLEVLRPLWDRLDLVVIDGYVWLENEQSPGLGAHLFAALNGQIPVVGVGKTFYTHAGVYRAVNRGTSRRPLYITAVGLDIDIAAAAVARMHGTFRIPTLIRLVDQLCRSS